MASDTVIEPAGWADHCGDFWRDHVLAETGDNIEDVVGKSPRSRRAWRAMLNRNDCASFAELVTKAHGDPVSAMLARRGDLALIGHGAIGIIRGELIEGFGGVHVPLEEDTPCWRVQVSQWAK